MELSLHSLSKCNYLFVKMYFNGYDDIRLSNTNNSDFVNVLYIGHLKQDGRIDSLKVILIVFTLIYLLVEVNGIG